MSGNDIIFQNCKPCFVDYTIHIVDGSLSKVASTISIVIFKNLTLLACSFGSKLELQSIVNW